MKYHVEFKSSDWGGMVWIAFTQISIAWIMAFADLVYAPIPMFAAAVVAGFLFRGRPREASLAGALAGLLGGGLVEWAFFVVRIQNRVLNWAQLNSNEQLGLAIAEMFLYASLLSFFAAFFSWGTSKEAAKSVETTEPDDSKTPSYAKMMEDQNTPKVDLPIFKEGPEGNPPTNHPSPDKPKK